MLEDGVGNTQVAFGVLEIDRVDLVRHGRGANFTGYGLLLEVAQGDIAPHVPVEVDQNGIETGHRIEQLGDVVVGLDLGGVGVEGQPQAVFDEAAGVGLPVNLGVGGQVGVVVAHRAVDLAQQRHALHLGNLPLQAVHHVGHLLAQSGGGGGLAVGTGEHGNIGKLHCQCADLVGNAAH